MKFKCRHCGKITNKDLRETIHKYFMTKRGYRSCCDIAGVNTFLVPMRNTKMNAKIDKPREC